MRIAACFYGIDRSLAHTHRSILTNVLDPIRSIGELKVFAHFYKQFTIDNPRSDEVNVKITPAWDLLCADCLILEEPDSFMQQELYEFILSYGDIYGDSGKSIRNLLHQLHSIRQVWLSANLFNPDIILFLRPDLIYHDNFSAQIRKVMRFAVSAIYTPSWQQWLGGLNDRFAICYGKQAAKAFSLRMSSIHEYCILNSLEKCSPKGLHAERLLYHALLRSDSFLLPTSLKASRVRANGYVVSEEFKDIHSSRVKASILWHNIKCLKRLSFLRLPDL